MAFTPSALTINDFYPETRQNRLCVYQTAPIPVTIKIKYI